MWGALPPDGVYNPVRNVWRLVGILKKRFGAGCKPAPAGIANLPGGKRILAAGIAKTDRTGLSCQAGQGHVALATIANCSLIVIVLQAPQA